MARRGGIVLILLAVIAALIFCPWAGTQTISTSQSFRLLFVNEEDRVYYRYGYSDLHAVPYEFFFPVNTVQSYFAVALDCLLVSSLMYQFNFFVHVSVEWEPGDWTQEATYLDCFGFTPGEPEKTFTRRLPLYFTVLVPARYRYTAFNMRIQFWLYTYGYAESMASVRLSSCRVFGQ